VHFVSAGAGGVIDDAPNLTYPVEQLRVALEHARSQLILKPSEFDRSLLTDPGESPRHASAPAPHRMRRKRPARGGDGAST